MYRHKPRPRMRLHAAHFACAAIRATLLVLASAGIGFSGQAAHAQGVTSPALVLDFDVAPGLDPILGRKAADAIAVEMEASGDFLVTPRQEIETAVAERSGLRAPYNPSTQRRLGEALGVRSVISGRIVSAIVGNQATNPRVREARVEMQVRQLDTRTGDFINGTQTIESTIDELGELDDDILINQATDKAAYSAIRALRLQVFPEGIVMHTTRNIIELSLGARNGVRIGQRYSVLRDIANKSRGANEANVTVQRIKVGEIVITSVEQDQSRAVLAAGGGLGVRTNDHVRRIFAPGLVYVEPLLTDGTGAAARGSRANGSQRDSRTNNTSPARNRQLERGSL